MATVSLEIQGPVAFVTLSNPGKLNAMSRAMWRALPAVFAEIQHSRVRVVSVRGEGGDFCAGGDIAEYPSFRFDREALREFHEVEVWGGLSALLSCDVPLVAQIDGACMGAGMEIASCCDLRIAGQSAKFGAPIARLGFPMAPREAQLVAQAAGLLTAREMLLGAGVLNAAEMHSRGFLNRVTEDAATASVVQTWLQRMADLAPQAARLNKQTLRRLTAAPDAALAELLPTAYNFAANAEHREGINAFLEKRPPVF